MNEQQIEQELIEKLRDLKYDHREDIRDRAALEQNFRAKFEALNRVHLTDSEFHRLLDQIVTPDVFANARHLRERNSFDRDDGTPLFYTLVNIKNWCKNDFEVVDQLRINTDSSHHRYDVILLVNGVPVVQIELKTLAISPRRAMQQIVDYRNDPGNDYGKTLLCFMQLFIVSNRSDTWYFANNNTRHFSFNAEERFLPIYRFAAEDNRKITRLDSFADAFLAKCILSEMISRYMVLVAGEQKLLMMRPYQIYAVKAIVDCIHQNCGNGYIWHTTGSGKTLTSFKASTLLKDNPDIEKCLFVVDRKDLDRQTREEFNKFQAGCVEENTNTEKLVQRLLSDNYADKVIVTTIQKLGLALDENSKRNQSAVKNGKRTYKQRLEPLRDKRMVFIFDECHRSQFGENHQAIKAFFPNAQLFGFTGTPIFEQNAGYQQIEGRQASYLTTEDLFQKQLHAYTITHAIDDRNVLRFHIDYYKPEGKSKPKPGEALTKKAIAEAILAKHDAATNQRRFNAILATASIDDAIAYPNQDLPHARKIDLIIVVDMLLTGFDSQYLNTLYADKKLQYHGLIQAFSRTNRVLNDTKPYGNILDFRRQQEAVDTAIGLFSGEAAKPPKEIWLVDAAPVVIGKLESAVKNLDTFMQSQELACAPEQVQNLKGDAARAQFINLFKEVQRLKTQLDQYTDLSAENQAAIEQILPTDQLQGFKGVYLETARRLKAQQDKDGDTPPEVQQLDFEFVLFTSTVIDYDYIMALIARYAQQPVDKQKMSRAELIGLIRSDAKLMDEGEELVAYIDSLDATKPCTVQGIREEYAQYKVDQTTRTLAEMAAAHGLEAAALQTFVDGILRRMIFDGEALGDLLAPLELGWKARARKELALMEDLIPLLHKLAEGREISGLQAYEL